MSTGLPAISTTTQQLILQATATPNDGSQPASATAAILAAAMIGAFGQGTPRLIRAGFLSACALMGRPDLLERVGGGGPSNRPRRA